MIGKNKITSTSIPNLIKKSISLSIRVYSTSITCYFKNSSNCSSVYAIQSLYLSI